LIKMTKLLGVVRKDPKGNRRGGRPRQRVSTAQSERVTDECRTVTEDALDTLYDVMLHGKYTVGRLAAAKLDARALKCMP
jgi:hypothetical protein